MFKNIFKTDNTSNPNIEWEELNSVEKLEEAKAISTRQKVLIFKHSTRCSISSSVLSRLERQWKREEVQDLKPYLLDLIAYRSISDKIAEDFEVLHESPQVLVLENKKAIYNASHYDIAYQDLSKLSA